MPKLPGLSKTLDIVIVRDPKEAREWVRRTGEKSPVTAETELHVFRGASLYVLHKGEEPISFHACYFGKRKKNVWEPYANWYTGYTVRKHRRQGYATRLALLAREEAIRRGCVRLKSKAGSILGLRLHDSLGDQFWGITEGLEIVIDTPLVANAAYDNRTPPNAVDGAGLQPWSADKVLRLLAGRTLRYEARDTKS